MKETVKDKEEGGRSKHTHPGMFGYKEGAQLFKAHLTLDRQRVKILIQEKFVGNKWVDGWRRGAAIICLNLY